jgi:hypothetical protein
MLSKTSIPKSDFGGPSPDFITMSKSKTDLDESIAAEKATKQEALELLSYDYC